MGPLTCQRRRARGREAGGGREGSQPHHLQPEEARTPAPPRPLVTSAPAGHSTAAPAGSPGADWPVEGEAGGRGREEGNPAGGCHGRSRA